MSTFAFLQREWPDVHEAAGKAVAWIYKHAAALRLPYQDNLSALIHEPTFKQAAGEVVFSKARVLNTLGNRVPPAPRLPGRAVT